MESNLFNRRIQPEAYLFVADALSDTVRIGAIIQSPCDMHKLTSEFLQVLKIELKDICLEESTFDVLNNMLTCASRYDYINDSDEVLEQYHLDQLDNSRRLREINFRENILNSCEKESIYSEAERFFSKDTFLPELDRIYAGCTRNKIGGHPVHYMIQTDDRETCEIMSSLLLQALYANNRICNKRYCCFELRPEWRFSIDFCNCLYKINMGGAIIIRYLGNENAENDHANCDREAIESLCEVMKKYHNQVLTVLCLPRECTAAKDIFYGNLGTTSMIELKEDFASDEQAKSFLKRLARDNGIHTDKRLFAKIQENRGYLTSDLRNLFDEWYSNKLKTDVYPQYKNIVTANREAAKAAPRGSAYDELNEMIGLDEAKKVINQALSYYKAQKIFADKGMKYDRPAMHMVFTGNPGTAKTSVARLFARIMKENHLLSKGTLIEVGRGDLVGKYVGWTAPTIQKKFREAQGSVLFIDEAYSLVDDRSGSYGDEAINTIVQEMENHREDVIVIFAGYPDKMEGFLQKNPGLRSRIAFYVPFADYKTNELCSIANLIAKKKGLKLTEDACEKLTEIFNVARTEIDFGNGRYVRNVIEKANMAHATRLLKADLNFIDRNDIVTICAEDIELPLMAAKKAQNPIGFCAS